MYTLDGTFVSMEELEQAVLSGDGEDLAEIIGILRRRYSQLYPDYELLVMALDKRKDPVRQLRQAADLLHKT